jgi:formaldehyde-activating enzyme involved in methanogenesis
MGTRSGADLSLQLAKFGVMDLAAANFKIEGNTKFQVKNEGSDAVNLEVIPADAEDDTFISVKFEVGWNPEIVREVKKNTTEGLALKWGY